MAVTKSKRKTGKLTIPEDEFGKPDIYALCEDRDMSVEEAAEAAGVSTHTAWVLFWRQEVEHNPDLKPAPQVLKNRDRLAKYVAKMRDEGEDGKPLRWEKIVHRTGKTKAELEELYEEATGKPSGRLRGAASEEEEKPAPKKGRKAKATEEEEEEAKPARRGSARPTGRRKVGAKK